MGVSSCSPCALGRYSDSSSATDCSPCPVNTYTASEASKSIQDCLPCPQGTSAPRGARLCEDCPAGKYAAGEGQECEKCLEGKSTNGLTGLSECLDCQAGSYQAGEGAEECTECGVNFYSEPGSITCLACPSGKTTNGLKGSATCSVPSKDGDNSGVSELNLQSRESVLNTFKSGMAYMITILFSIAFAVFGYFIMASRVKNPQLCALAPALVLVRMAMVALSLTSEAFFLAICFVEGHIDPFFSLLGYVVVGFRSVNILPTSFVLYAVFGSGSSRSGNSNSSGSGKSTLIEKYKRCFDADFFLAIVYPYAVFSFMAMLDATLIFLLPWRYSEFAFLAKGYPDMYTLRVTQFTKIVGDSARLTCNILYIMYAKDEAGDWRVELMTYVNLLASVASILLAGMVAIMKNSVLKEVEAKMGTAADIYTEEGRCDGDGIELLTIEYSNNPMNNSSAGVGPIKITGFDPDMTMRAFLVKLLPDIDGPSVHAVDTAFKDDGVERMEDLLLYLEGGVLGMTDLKNYSKRGKLDMAHTLKLSRAVEHLLEERVKTDEDNHNRPALLTPDRPPRKVVAWSGHTSEKEKGQLDTINKVITDTFSEAFSGAFEVVSNRVKDILQDEDVQGSDTLVTPDNSVIAPGPEHEDQEIEWRSYASRRSSSVDRLAPQTIHPPPPPPLPPGNERNSMTNMASIRPQTIHPPPPPSLPPGNKRNSMANMASISQSKALRSGSLLKPSGRRKSSTDNFNHGDSANNLKSIQEQEEGVVPR